MRAAFRTGNASALWARRDGLPSLAGIVLLLAMTLPAVAHHSVLPFDRENFAVLDGVVSEVRWRNPHVRLKLNVLNDAGEEEEWEATRIIDMASAGIPDDAPRSLLGYSVGRFVDRTLPGNGPRTPGSSLSSVKRTECGTRIRAGSGH